MSGKINIAPTGHVITVFANQNLTWKISICEQIDNALDADASNIKFIFDGKRSLFISDNGIGCPVSGLEKLVQLGGHEKHKSGTTKLGRYGIGAKDAALWIGGDSSTISIKSVHEHKRSSLRLNWKEIRENGWEIDRPTVADAEATERGTQIKIEPVTRTLPHGQQWADLLAEIGYVYSPAIKREGVQISFQRSLKAQPEIVKRWEMPPLDDQKPMINRDLMVGDQRARVCCGIVKEGYENPRRGLTYFHEFRVIVPHSSNGCGPYNISRICGYVELDHSWPLTKNKDNIRNPEDLYREVQAVCLPVLQTAEAIGEVIQSKAFEDEVSKQVRFALETNPNARAKRKKGDTHKTIVPTNSEKKHQRAESTQTGSRFPDNGAGAGNLQRVIFDHLGDNAGFGLVEKPNIYLNEDIDWIRHIKTEGNAEAAAGLAACLVANHAHECTDTGQMMLKGMYREADFKKIMTAILSGMPIPKASINLGGLTPRATNQEGKQ